MSAKHRGNQGRRAKAIVSRQSPRPAERRSFAPGAARLRVDYRACGNRPIRRGAGGLRPLPPDDLRAGFRSGRQQRRGDHRHWDGDISGGPYGVGALTCNITTLTNQSGGTIGGGASPRSQAARAAWACRTPPRSQLWPISGGAIDGGRGGYSPFYRSMAGAGGAGVSSTGAIGTLFNSGAIGGGSGGGGRLGRRAGRAPVFRMAGRSGFSPIAAQSAVEMAPRASGPSPRSDSAAWAARACRTPGQSRAFPTVARSAAGSAATANLEQARRRRGIERRGDQEADQQRRDRRRRGWPRRPRRWRRRRERPRRREQQRAAPVS